MGIVVRVSPHPRWFGNRRLYLIPSTSCPTTQHHKIRASAMSSSSSSSSVPEWDGAEKVVQYVVVRRDLIETWPLGSVITQGCHASVAAISLYKDDPLTIHYCSPLNLESMHKVTLEVKGEIQMINLAHKLTNAGIHHKLWIELPENIPTCIATKPYPKSFISPFFKTLKLCK